MCAARSDPSDVIAGRYKIERTLSGGGMGRVVVARHLGLGERVAIKFLRAEQMGKASVERLRREARAAARLRGQHVVRVMDVGDLPDGTPYIVMEYAAGRDLGRELEATGPVSPTLAVDWVLQACEALAEAHRSGIVHRDIKPGNLILTKHPDGGALIKLLDFGIAKLDRDSLTLTGTRDMLGSPRYMSPEQVRDARTVDPRTDIWSLGVLLYELVSAKLPFEAFSVPGYVARLEFDPPEPLRTHAPTVSPEFEAVVLRCLEKDPTLRFQDVGELASALVPHGPPGARDAADRVRRVLEEPRTPVSEPPEPFVDAPHSDRTFATVSTTARGHRTTRKVASRRRSLWIVPPAIAGIAIFMVWSRHGSRPEPAPAASAIAAAPTVVVTAAPVGIAPPRANEPAVPSSSGSRPSSAVTATPSSMPSPPKHAAPVPTSSPTAVLHDAPQNPDRVGLGRFRYQAPRH